jgi:hypothetical protein
VGLFHFSRHNHRAPTGTLANKKGLNNDARYNSGGYSACVDTNSNYNSKAIPTLSARLANSSLSLGVGGLRRLGSPSGIRARHASSTGTLDAPATALTSRRSALEVRRHPGEKQHEVLEELFGEFLACRLGVSDGARGDQRLFRPLPCLAYLDAFRLFFCREPCRVYFGPK